MVEYIEFEATKQAIDRIRSVYHRVRNFNAVSVIDNVFGEIKEIPAADVAQVVHGKWLNFYNDYSCAECDRCGTTFEVTDNESDEGLWNEFKRSYNYCPNCGAKMGKEEHDNV